MASARYAKTFMPLRKVKEKEFLSRSLGCKGVGFSFVRCKPGEGATYVLFAAKNSNSEIATMS